MDSEESWAKDLAEEGIVSKFIALDFSDESLVFEKCLDVIKQVEKVRRYLSLTERPPSHRRLHVVPFLTRI